MSDMSDIDVLRELLASVYLTPPQKAALGRMLGSAARSPGLVPVLDPKTGKVVRHASVQELALAGPRCGMHESPLVNLAFFKCGCRYFAPPPKESAAVKQEPILTEAEKERERAILLGPIGGGQ